MAGIEDFTPDSLVLVTGANGHVAQHVVSQLLLRPAATRPRVRATVRSQRSAGPLAQVFAEHLSNGKLEIILVPDIVEPGAFVKAVSSCTHVAHIASPLVVNPKDTVNDLFKPAIQGTTGLLESAAQSDSVKSVVITSSFAAVFDPSHGLRPNYTYTEADWSTLEYDEIADPNLDLTRWPSRYRTFITYLASKKLSERAAWDFYAKSKPSWRLSVINPTYIGGPCIVPLGKGPESFSFSNQLMWSVVSSKEHDALPEVDFPAWVDVRDVARAHIQALITPEAKGKRFILAPHQVVYSAFADVARKQFPELKPSTQVQTDEYFSIATTQADEVLAMKPWISFKDMVVDTVNEVRKWEGRYK